MRLVAPWGIDSQLCSRFATHHRPGRRNRHPRLHREAGVRDLAGALGALCAQVLRRRAEGRGHDEHDGNEEHENDGEHGHDEATTENRKKTTGTTGTKNTKRRSG